jgi:protein-S-isoprenylcysteine O-methyltransferase Ste14
MNTTVGNGISNKSILLSFFTCLASLIIFIGIPLAAWGLRDLSGFFDHPVRFAFVVAMVLLQIFAAAYNPLAGKRDEKRKDGVKRHKIDLVLIQILSLAIVFVAPFSDSHSIGVFHLGETFRSVGFIFLIPGFILMQVAEKTLDKQFSVEVTIQKSHMLIMNGPYAFIRHPRYLGILAFFTGISLVFQSLLAMSFVLLLSIVLLWRVHAEESLMLQEFGPAWEAYCGTSWRLIPFVF